MTTADSSADLHQDATATTRPDDPPPDLSALGVWDPRTGALTISAVPGSGDWLGSVAIIDDLRVLLSPSCVSGFDQLLVSAASASISESTLISCRAAMADSTHLRIRAFRPGLPGTEVFLALDMEAAGAGVGSDVEHRRQALRIVELSEQVEHLSSYLAVVAHDLKTPLQSVSNFTDVILDRFADDLPTEVTEILGFIGVTAERSAQLTRDVLNHASLRRGAPGGTADLAELAREAWLEMAPEDARLLVEDEMMLEADPALLRRLVSTLLDNAVKYRRADQSLVVTIAIERHPRECRVTMTDNGRGIPLGRHSEAFDMFTRYEAASSEGNGMGLAICRRIVELHRGHIWAEQRPRGPGTRIVFSLPTITQQEVAAP